MDARKSRPGSKGSSPANTLEYQGYIGVIEYDDEAGIFHGEIINLRDVITFQGLAQLLHAGSLKGDHIHDLR